MAYGLTDEGFTVKRLQDIRTELQQTAVTLFQDVVPPGDSVDTTDSSLLGRLISLIAPSISDLWEVGQMDYSALDPNSATGIALDNIVAYGGISRYGESYTTAIGLFSGDNGTLIASGNTVKASVTGNQFTTVDSVAINPSSAAGVVVSVLNVQNTSLYAISYSTSSSSTSTVSYISSASATASEILNGLLGEITSSHPLLSASIAGTTLVVDKADVFQVSNFSVSPNLVITKAKKLGSIQASAVGVIEQEANTIDTIVTPVLGWDSITNPLVASTGRLKETDEELRLRFRNTKLEKSTNILDSLYSALINLDGVEEVAIYENDTNVTDSKGVAGHGFLPVVLGGSSQLIAETIWENKPIGILSQGNTAVDVTDSQGFIHSIGFERPNPITIYIVVNLSLNPEDSNVFPADGADQIREAIISYASANFGIGDDVIFSRLYTPINTVNGHQIDSLFVGTSPSPVTSANVVIAFNEISSFESVNITVNV